MYSGRLIFSQIMDFMPLHTFRRCVARYQVSYNIDFQSASDAAGRRCLFGNPETAGYRCRRRAGHLDPADVLDHPVGVRLVLKERIPERRCNVTFSIDIRGLPGRIV